MPKKNRINKEKPVKGNNRTQKCNNNGIIDGKINKHFD